LSLFRMSFARINLTNTLGRSLLSGLESTIRFRCFRGLYNVGIRNSVTLNNAKLGQSKLDRLITDGRDAVSWKRTKTHEMAARKDPWHEISKGFNTSSTCMLSIHFRHRFLILHSAKGLVVSPQSIYTFCVHTVRAQLALV